jgi:hypothetical protein
MHQIGTYVFLLSGLISLILITIFLFILFRLIKQKNTSSKKLIISLILSIFILINFLYFTNLIPPIPLSIKDSGIYHLIERNQNGNLEITSENKAWWEYWKLYPNYMAVSGSPVYAFSAVFSPTNLNLTIVHEWQHYDEIQKKWITQSRINLSVVGGRDGGFRTYSKLWNLTPGKWRVNIETKQNQIIGNIRFNLVQVDTEPAFTTTVLSK